MKIPIVREWGSWVVFISSWVAALIAGLSTHPWETGRNIFNETVITISGLTFLINAKNPLASVLRTKGQKKGPALWLLFFSITGLALLTPFLIDGAEAFSVFSPLILTYVILLSRGKEHHIMTELIGFSLLTLSAPIVYFVITGDVSLKLYAAVLIFFAAGVFKVRARVRKTLAYRWAMFFYCAIAIAVFYYLEISLILLLPFGENILSVLLMREEKLKTTGNTELIKSIIFIILIWLFWN